MLPYPPKFGRQVEWRQGSIVFTVNATTIVQEKLKESQKMNHLEPSATGRATGLALHESTYMYTLPHLQSSPYALRRTRNLKSYSEAYRL